MKTALSTALVIGSALLVGAATDDDPLAGYAIAGKPERCVSRVGVGSGNGPVIAGDQLITYQESPRRLWVTRPITTCTHMDAYDVLVVDQYGSQTCRGDRFRVIRQGLSIPSAFCIFGDFTPYDKIEKPRTG